MKNSKLPENLTFIDFFNTQGITLTDNLLHSFVDLTKQSIVDLSVVATGDFFNENFSEEKYALDCVKQALATATTCYCYLRKLEAENIEYKFIEKIARD